MSFTKGITEVPSSSTHRDYRLSPRCIVTNTCNGLVSGGNSAGLISKNCLPYNKEIDQQKVYDDHLLIRSECIGKSESIMALRSEHARQDSALSSTSNEISQYLCNPPNRRQHSRPPSLLDSPLSATSWSFHSRQSSLEGISTERRSSNRKKKKTPSPLNHPPPPPYCFTNNQVDIPKQISPSSMDLGYHTLSNNSGNYNNIAFDSESIKEKHQVVLNRNSASSTPKHFISAKPQVSSRLNSNLSKLSLRNDISLLPERHKLMPGANNISQNIKPTGLVYDHERILVNPSSETVLFKCANNQRKVCCGFDDLSNDLILKILSKLSTVDLSLCAQVCRRFYFLAWEPILWKSISIDGTGSKCINADHAIMSMLKVLSRNPSSCLSNSQNTSFKQTSLVQNIVINDCSSLTDIGLLCISDKCPDLRRLELPNCAEITNIGIQALVTSCTSLDYLNLKGKFYDKNIFL